MNSSALSSALCSKCKIKRQGYFDLGETGLLPRTHHKRILLMYHAVL